jgi:hypothetical protein
VAGSTSAAFCLITLLYKSSATSRASGAAVRARQSRACSESSRRKAKLRWEGVNYTVSNDCIDLVVLDQTATVVGAVPGNFDGFRYWEVRLARRLERGDLYQLRACKVVTDREREPLPFFTYIARRSVNRVVVRVEFAADCLPATVTRFVTPTTRVPEVTISSQLVPLDGGVVESVFTDTLEGLSYGFIWRWDEAERSR